MTEQGYNYLDRSIQEILGFFEIWVENLETLTPSPVVRNLLRKKKKKNAKKWKAVSIEDSDKDASDDKKRPRKKKFCLYHRKCSLFTDKCTTLEAIITKAKFNKSKGYKKGSKKT